MILSEVVDRQDFCSNSLEMSIIGFGSDILLDM